MKFGLQNIKLLALICTALNSAAAIALIARAFPDRNIWSRSALGTIFQSPFDYALIFGIIYLLITIFGYIAICLNGYGMLIVYNILLACSAIILIIYGAFLWSQCNSEHPKIGGKLTALIHTLSPRELDRIQGTFRCCGVEKYTDYLTLWDMGSRVARLVRTTTDIYKAKSFESKRTVSPDNEEEDLQGQPSLIKKKFNWKRMPIRIDKEGALEFNTDAPPIEPTRVWKSFNALRGHSPDGSSATENKKMKSKHGHRGTRSDVQDENFKAEVGGVSSTICQQIEKLVHLNAVDCDRIIKNYLVSWMELLVY